MKYFVLADVHSFYDNTIDTLSASGFDIDNPLHITNTFQMGLWSLR